MRRAFLMALAAVASVAHASPAGAEIAGAQLVLEVTGQGAPGRYPEAAPPRFVLLERGQFFVGGSRQIAGGRLESSELRALESRVERLRKLQGLGSQVELGPGGARYRLQLLGKRPLEIVANGDPKNAPASLQPLASLLADLEDFDHPSLRFLKPESFLLVAREGRLSGGCRRWSFGFAPAEAGSGRVGAAAAASDWPQGVHAASACAGEQHFVVTLRPLLPGERP
jgi:hypothetical protein